MRLSEHIINLSKATEIRCYAHMCEELRLNRPTSLTPQQGYFSYSPYQDRLSLVDLLMALDPRMLWRSLR